MTRGVTAIQGRPDMVSDRIRLIVEADCAGTRLDRYIADHVPDLSRSYVRQLIDADNVLLNEQHARPSVAVRLGDVITIQLPEPQAVDLVSEAIPLTVVYEDADVAVIDKPAGMVVHPAPGHASGTLVHALLARFPDIQIGGNMRPGIVHRLDRDTSGLMVITRNDRAQQHIQAQQQARTMLKGYLALVEGRMKADSGLIDAPLDRHPQDRLRMAIVTGGRAARTHWQVLEELGSYTLLDIRLETGRTHQIRVHFASQHHPVLGDAVYGPKRQRTPFGLKRQFLHAYKLGFKLPSTQEWIELRSALPDDLKQALERARKKL